MSYYTGYNGFEFKLPEWKDPFPNGINRKYWDLSYYTEDPKSYAQLKDQKFAGSFFPPLENYHVSKEQETRFKHTLSLYGLKFEDITYPHTTALGGTSASFGSGARGVLQISKNINRLYR